MVLAVPTLKGKRVLITGGSLGIGLETAKHCAMAGAQVIIASRTESDLKRALDDLNRIRTDGHGYEILDVSDLSSVKRCCENVNKKFGSLDGLVNCAGVYGPMGPLQDVDMEEFASCIGINFMGTVYMCHYFSGLMMNRSAKIINYSGGGGAAPFPNFSAYAASKTAILRLTENLAEEFRPLGISVNAVGPGFVVTRLHDQTLKSGDKVGKKFLEFTKQQIEKGGVPAEKAARLTVFLLSSDSEGINGKFISAPWDPWETEEFLQKLKTRKNFATIRRIDDMNFTEKPA